MIIDKSLEFCTDKALSAGSGASDVVDLKAGGSVLANEPVVVINSKTAAAGGTSITVEIQTDDNPSFVSPKTLYVTPPIPAASLAAGKKVAAFKFPRGAERYVRAYINCTGTFTAGAVDVFCCSGDNVGFDD